MPKNTYKSIGQPKSSIIKSTYIDKLTSLFGYRVKNTSNGNKKVDFVRVDLNNPTYKFRNATLGSVFKSQTLSSTLEKYFDSYVHETSLLYDDIRDRQSRLNELSFFYYNDPFGSRVVELVAAEATQCDMQNRILSIESSNPLFVKRCYELFFKWGITQQVLQQVCKDLELYGESFWMNKVTKDGIKKIKQIKVNSIIERLEFSPTHVAEHLAQMRGAYSSGLSRLQKIVDLINLNGTEKANDIDENLADAFDDKLFGFELHDNLIVGPWNITHFRFNPNNSEFYPYGRPPLLACLAPFKQAFTSMILQGLARQMSFPITMYKVKGTEGFGPDVAFEHVNTVREEYDNLGVSADSAGGEVYTVNTKMWIPDGLVDIDVKESKCDIDFMGDIENYQDRVAIAAGVPKAYLDQEFGGFGNSAVSLVEQYKPFARHVYTIQSACLEGIADLIRLHFAITNEFDYNTPFLLSMRFPADALSDQTITLKSSTLELASKVIDFVKTSLGVDSDSPLPEDVINDIANKYTFLDIENFKSWATKINNAKITGESESDEDESEEEEAEEAEEATKMKNKVKNTKLKKMDETTLKRMQEISHRYNESKEVLFFNFVESNFMTEWTGNDWSPSGQGQGNVSHKILAHKLDDDDTRLAIRREFDGTYRNMDLLNESSI